MNTQTKAAVSRPISPHLQVYALHTKITSLLSILHRIAGAGLMTVGTLFFLLWIVSAAGGEASFTLVQEFYGSFFGFLVLFAWTVLLFYHFANGIRHLLWDTGYGFEIPQIHFTGMVMLAGAAGLTVLTWIIGIIVFV
ncbi:MAG: succinate dehydrogenase, cytochrome b556 subunit [Rhodospirillaceae bacterium]